MNLIDNYQDLANAVLATAVTDVVAFKVVDYFHPVQEDRIPHESFFSGVGNTRKINKKFPCYVQGRLYRTEEQYQEHRYKQGIHDALCRYREMEKDANEALAFLRNPDRLQAYTDKDPAFFEWAIEEKFHQELEWEFEKIFTGVRQKRYSRNKRSR